jgi:prepilin-type N-terminal cleavage/methylation domain-containing protein
MTQRSTQAFTLMELMIVVAIIGILAALVMPATSYALRIANEVKCDNNLSQIAKGMLLYRQEDGEERNPLAITDLIRQSGFSGRMFNCPMDASKGKDNYIGRRGLSVESNGPQYLRVYEPGCSYLYEASSETIAQSTALGKSTADVKFSDDDFDYFYRNLVARQSSENVKKIKDELSQEKFSWQAAKDNFQRFGNLKPNIRPNRSSDIGVADLGDPFPASEVPIVRCYWHEKWNSNNQDTSKKVRNISLAFNTFTSITYWEVAYNPNIPK